MNSLIVKHIIKKGTTTISNLLFLVLFLIIANCVPSEITRDNVIVTGVPVNTTASGTQISGIVIDFKGEIEQHGHCWATFQAPTLERNEGVTEKGIKENRGEFLSNIVNLLPERDYFIRGYATIDGKIVYGDEVNFRTLDIGSDPSKIVTTYGITNIEANSAIATGSIGVNESLIASFGHCWSKTPNPQVNDFKTQFEDTSNLEDFRSELIDLEPTTVYYVRAYYQSSDSNVVYGNELNFTTASF